MNAGVVLHGEVDVNEPRYLCEQHFSSKYINKQSRRKMLVHTAVPRKWSAEIDEPQFVIVGSQPDRKRKFSNINLTEINLSVLPDKSKTLVRRSSSRLVENTSASSIEAVEENEVQEMVDEQIEETTETPRKTMKTEVHPTVSYEEMHLGETNHGSKVQYIVVKPKAKVANNTPRILNISLNSQLLSAKKVYENFEQLEPEETEEVGDISSTNIETFEDEKNQEMAMNESKKSEALESYSEFIFNGEKYVQMPKRVFEAEKEKVRKEAERCKHLLRKLKKHLNNMDLD